MSKTVEPLGQAWFEAVVFEWSEILLLQNWTLKVELVDQEFTNAEVEWESMYDEAVLRFNPRKVQERPDIAHWERTVIHELLHLCDRDRHEHFKSIEVYLGEHVFELHKLHVDKATEAQIDRMATILYRLKRG